MIAKEAKEIVLGMELSSDVLKEVEGILSVYAESDEVPEEVINNILLIVDKEVDVNKLVADDDEINNVL
ncbi:MAG: hypothetical protein US68_C0005G0014 [Candidatus Shapirobacteria bacterium GW2011_GWE1_38_10]|uniref:Uncharacterized protein n=1 Tax=Candidatus Shapirobacteria bacterium GW2011_GWE1_38_10 TaxID=1618488 RepID=A0A0G0I7C0_9BACT|nr:MAG: hypothetical protein US46_C0001G0007 [Candidatus Shapirobacteria bacterium GW2011_GWF2_37_20]KKQ50447.1 MAG: hypothetical protein US68_C0005G0014 [Candidatus Shapirobacteria bacterium GW2011_GWE1_38_10]KKQ65103.1 MAG: hypothetical protein US85_C0001G0030 [Candidatus Shapirobacteria bacterium GW2011_GWF1_38_23]HBP50860.1 hypothetical protein [Candidatus Shapirobacteria bacterium]